MIAGATQAGLTEYCHMIADARRPRQPVITRMPYRVQPYGNQRKETQAKCIYDDAIQSTAI